MTALKLVHAPPYRIVSIYETVQPSLLMEHTRSESQKRVVTRGMWQNSRRNQLYLSI